MAFENIRVITAKIRDGKMTITELLDVIKTTDIRDSAPREWVLFMEKIVNSFYNLAFWTEVSSAPCFRTLKYNRRFFPMPSGMEAKAPEAKAPEGKAEAKDEKKDEKDEVDSDDDEPTPKPSAAGGFKTIASGILRSHYPEMDVSSCKPANYSKPSMAEISNYGSILPRSPTTPDNTDWTQIRCLIEALRLIESYDLIARLIYYLCIGYDTCHHMYFHPYMIDLITESVDGKYRDMILTGIRYGNMILAHEEEAYRDKRELLPDNQRFIITATQLHNVRWLPKVSQLDLSINPLITVCSSGYPIYSRLGFYLSGTRSIPTTEEIARRIRIVTCGAFEGVDAKFNYHIVSGVRVRREYVSLCGSLMTQIAGDNSLGDFERRSKLYYSGGDIDVLVSEKLYKPFTTIALQMMDLMDTNLKCKGSHTHTMSKSGFRFSYKNPVLDRVIEIFKSPQDATKLVSTFHMPSVKARWNFSDLIMLHSFTTAMLTGVCNTFDWFSTNKSPPAITLKNAQRGYATHHNTKELEVYEALLAVDDHEWSYPTIAKQRSITGIHKAEHLFFCVDTIPRGVRFGQPIIHRTADEPIDMSTSTDSSAGALSLRYHDVPIKFWHEGSGSQWYVSIPPSFT